MPGPADPRGWIRTARVKRTTIRAVWIANRPGALLTRVVGGSDDGQLLEVSVESFSAGVRIIRRAVSRDRAVRDGSTASWTMNSRPRRNS
jgi:hypothetical protein